MKVLIVDDNADDRKLLRLNLERHDCGVIEAGDGEQGLALARTENPDLIISDVLMPRLDGFQFLWRLNSDEELRQLPFVFYSAVYTGSRDEELAYRLGAEAFIRKPQEPEAFWKKLSGILRGYSPPEEKEAAGEPLDEEKEYLREYSGIVAAKLETKVQELEASLARRKKVEAELRKLHSAIEQSPVSIVITDTEGGIEYVNPKFCQLTGYSFGEVRGKNPRILQSGETPAELYRQLWATLTEGKVWHGEFHNAKKNGELFWEYATISPVRDRDGKITHYTAVKEDITERKKLEDQLRQSQKMEAVGLLAGGIAHDFNNILMAIIGFGGILQMKMPDSDPLRCHVDRLLESADRAAGLTQSLLAFSRKQVIRPQPTNLNTIVAKMEKLLARIIGEDVEIQPNFRDDPLNVNVDLGQIEQVLMNLATNARDAMSRGGVLAMVTEAVDISEQAALSRGDCKPGRYARLSVIDNGAGMDSATVQRVFDPFFTTKEPGRGTGLGLSIVYGIVAQHRGLVEVESEPGRGTAFRILLPLLAGEAKPEAEPDLPPPTGGSETILLAEDDADIRQLAQEVLTEFGYTVIVAVDGEDALGRFREHRERIELLLLDLVMPKMNGQEVVAQIRREGCRVPIIFLSGYPPDSVQRNGLHLAQGELLMKPISPQNLLRKIREVLNSAGPPGGSG